MQLRNNFSVNVTLTFLTPIYSLSVLVCFFFFFFYPFCFFPPPRRYSSWNSVDQEFNCIRSTLLEERYKTNALDCKLPTSIREMLQFRKHFRVPITASTRTLSKGLPG